MNMMANVSGNTDIYFWSGGQAFGPHTREEIVQFWKTGQIQPDAFYWGNGTDNFRPVKELLKEPVRPTAGIGPKGTQRIALNVQAPAFRSPPSDKAPAPAGFLKVLTWAVGIGAGAVIAIVIAVVALFLDVADTLKKEELAKQEAERKAAEVQAAQSAAARVSVRPTILMDLRPAPAGHSPEAYASRVLEQILSQRASEVIQPVHPTVTLRRCRVHKLVPVGNGEEEPASAREVMGCWAVATFDWDGVLQSDGYTKLLIHADFESMRVSGEGIIKTNGYTTAEMVDTAVGLTGAALEAYVGSQVQ